MIQNKVLITKVNNRQCVCLMLQDRLDRVYIEPTHKSEFYDNGTIVIGRVEKVISGIGAAFLSLGGKEQYFMSLPKKNETAALLVNRPYDGTIKCGDEIVVQVIKQAIKQKQAIVDYKLSFAGTYCVLEYGQKGLQVSAKLSAIKRNTIKDGFQAYLKEHESSISHKIIVRTNADFVTNDQELYNDYETMRVSLERLIQIYKYRPCFSVLYEGKAPYIDFIKNIRLDLYEEIVSDDIHIIEKLKDLVPKPLRFYDDLSYPLIKCYSLEVKLQDLLKKKAWLKSGGFLIIEQGETLTAIDVNSGKSDKKHDLAFATNMEAVKEIFLQIRARNISGMILIDFINLSDKELEKQLIQAIKEEIQKDYVKTQYIDITGLGLVELTREKKLPSLQEIWMS